MWEILGINPTTDIKEIKSAYARLAKQYNPEEKPEEFKRIFDAYKAACEYARIRRRFSSADFSSEKRSKNISESRRNSDSENDTHEQEEASGYDFSDVDTNSKTRRDENTSDKKDGTEFDFSDVDTNGKAHKDENTSDEINGAEFDFSDIETNGKSPENDDTPNEKFDFSSVNENYSDSDEEARISSLRIDLIRRINRIFDERSEADIEKWNDFFNDTYFDEMVFDRDFRMQTRKIFGTHLLPHYAAKLVSEKFGAGTKYFSRGLNQYTVVISNDNDVRSRYNQNSGKDSRKSEGKKFWIITAAVILYMAVPVLKAFTRMSDIPSTPSYSYSFDTTTMPSYITINPNEADPNKIFADFLGSIVSERAYDSQTLYNYCTGSWLFDFGYVKFNEDYEAEINFYGDIFKGTVSVSAAEKGAVLYMIFSSEDEAADGTEFTAELFGKEKKSIVYTDSEGKEHTGFFNE